MIDGDVWCVPMEATMHVSTIKSVEAKSETRRLILRQGKTKDDSNIIDFYQCIFFPKFK